MEVILIYPTPEGSQEIIVRGERMSFGRGGEADYRFDDEGLSRLNSTIFRDGARVWIVDENSTNGTFVNGQEVRGSGTPLKNGDAIKIGNFTKLNVRISAQALNQPKADKPAKKTADSVASAEKPSMLIPLAVTAVALFVIGISAVIIGVKVFTSSPEITFNDSFNTPEQDFDDDEQEDEKKPDKTPSPEKTPTANQTIGNVDVGNLTAPVNSSPSIPLPAGKKYQSMSDDEKNRYIAAKAENIAGIIGNQKSEPIPPEAVQEIKKYVNGYASRLAKARKDNCSQGGWVSSDFTTVLERASKTTPFISRSFYAERVAPQLGIYVAMIESEHCACLESPTHAKGMFQFLASSAPDYGLNPDQRCEPEPASKAAAKYLKSLVGRFGTAADSVPLAIASYNSGQGSMSKNLDTVMAAAANQNRSFWTLAANKTAMEGKAGKQFNAENITYVPKFFATAIIGENPQDFGVNLQPLSTYTK